MADKIQVAVRIRPVLSQKKDVELHWHSSDKGTIFQIDPATRKRLGNPYPFDQVFGSETKNHEIFSHLVEPLIDSAMKGFNVTVLAYGQTASGKTYTMMGSPQEMGIVQSAVQRIFTVIENTPERQFLLRCSYIEIYNESISDLLSSSNQKLKVQDLAEGNVVVQNLIEVNINTPDAVMKLMQQGNKQRKVGGTSMNERSSRSHTIFRIIVESQEDGNTGAVTVSHINLVDLAGSEKASQTNATGDRFREGCAINTSLSALSLVIKQLSDREGFVNFRDSKLTHILRASLGGNARTAIICNITPTVLDETSSTLKFACSAKTVQNQPQVNEVLSDQALLRKYNNYIKDLERKLKEKEQEKKPEAIEEMEKLLEEKDMKIHELKQQLVVSSCSESFVSHHDDTLSALKRSQRRMTWGGDFLKGFKAAPVVENVPFAPSVTVKRGSSCSNATATTPVRFECIEEVADVEVFGTESFIEANEFFASPTPAALGAVVAKSDAATMTDDVFSIGTPTVGSATPGPVLRERLRSKALEYEELKEELDELASFTRLEQQIGVHAHSVAKVSSEEAAEQLRLAQQTANDMEVLYLDTQRKLSQLQTQQREKELSYEEELASLRSTFNGQMDSELAEKKSLTKELAEIKDKHERLARDQAEYETHLSMVTDRASKREADLRQSLQEAWSELERLGGGGGISSSTKDDADRTDARLQELSHELEQMRQQYEEAQAQIASLSDQLERARHGRDSDDGKAHFMDNSLSGMCLADELRDVLADEELVPIRDSKRPRKRPSSYLSVALAKMDQSSNAGDIPSDGAKKTRLSLPASSGEAFCTDEIAVIRDHLVELQTVLLRYEEEFEVLGREKEDLLQQLRRAQAPARAAHDPNEESHQTSVVMDNSSFDASALITDHTLSKMDDTADLEKERSEAELRNANNQVRQLREELTGAQEALLDAQSRAQALEERLEHEQQSGLSLQVHEQLQEQLARSADEVHRLSAELEANQRSLEQLGSQVLAMQQFKAEAEEAREQLSLSNDRIRHLDEALESQAAQLEESRKCLADAATRIEALELSDDRAELKTHLDEAVEQVRLITEELQVKTAELDAARSELDGVAEANDQVLQLQEKLSNACEETRLLEEQLKEKSLLLNEALAKNERDAEARDQVNQLQENLTESSERIQILEVKLETKSLELDEVRSKMECDVEVGNELNQLLEKSNESTHQIRLLGEELESKKMELDAALSRIERDSEAMDQANHLHEQLSEATEQVRLLEEELQAKRMELDAVRSRIDDDAQASDQTFEEKLNEALEQIRVLSEELEAKKVELVAARSEVECDAELREQMVLMQENLNEATEKIQLFKEELETKTMELDAARSQIESNSELKDRMEQLQDKLSEANEQIRLLGVELEAKSVELDITRSKLECDAEARRKLDHLQEQLNEASEEIRLLNEELEAKALALAEVHSKTDLEAEATEEIRVLREDLEAKNLELEAARSIIESHGGVSEQIRLLDQQLESKSMELDAVRNQVDSNNSEIRDLREALEHKTNELAEAHRSHQDACVRIEELQLSVGQLEGLRANLEASSQQLTALRQQLDQTVADLDSARQIAERHVDAEDVEKRKLKDALDQATEELQRLTEELDSTASEAAASSRLLEEARSKIDHLEEEQASRGQLDDSEKQKLRDEFEQATEQVRLLQAARTELDDLVGSQEQKLSQVRQHLEEARSRVESLEALQVQVRQLEEKLEVQSIELSAAREALASAATDQDEDSSRVSALNGELQQLQDELAEVRQALVLATAKTDDLEALQGELQVEKMELATSRQALDEALDRINQLGSELDAKTAALDTAQCAVEAVRSKAAQLERENVEIRAEWSQSLEKLTQLTQELDIQSKARNAAEDASLEASARIQTTEERIVQLEKDLSRALDQVHDLNKKLTAASGSADVAECKIRSLEQAEREAQQQWYERVRQLEERADIGSSELATSERRARDLLDAKRNLEEQVARLEQEMADRDIQLANLESAAEKKDALQRELERGREVKDQLSIELTRLEEENRSLSDQLREANSSQDRRKDQFQQVEQLLEERERQLTELRHALDAVETTRDLLISQVHDKENAAGELQKALELSNQRVSFVQDQWQASKDEKHQLAERVGDLQSQLEAQQAQLEVLRNQAQSLQVERDRLLPLGDRLEALRRDKDLALREYDQMRELHGQQLEREEEVQRQMQSLTLQHEQLLQEKAGLLEDHGRVQQERDAVAQDHRRVSQLLTEHQHQVAALDQQVADLSATIADLKAVPTAPTGRYAFEESPESLKRQLVAAQSAAEVQRLEFEAEAENRKKKMERLEKDLDSLKQQYAKCKEELRLLRFQSDNEATVKMTRREDPRPASVATQDFMMQTDPISDKGFGFRWQMEQYQADNDRLRKKVSDLGERMEFYKTKLIKYRSMYYESNGQQPPAESASKKTENKPTAPKSESPVPTSHGAGDVPTGPSVRQLKERFSMPSPSPAAPSPAKLSAAERRATGAASAAAATRFAAARKESLTKEEMEKINNCNPS